MPPNKKDTTSREINEIHDKIDEKKQKLSEGINRALKVPDPISGKPPPLTEKKNLFLPKESETKTKSLMERILSKKEGGKTRKHKKHSKKTMKKKFRKSRK
jgi:hypothetical protein